MNKQYSMSSAKAAKPEMLTLRGVVAAPDAYGRLRFLLLERKNDKAYDTCWAALAKAAPSRDDYHVPYSIHEPDADGIRGEFTVTLERTKKTKYSTVDKAAYWTKFVEPLRGKEVEVDVRVHWYSFTPKDKEPIKGYSLQMVEVRDPTANQ